MKRFLLTLLVIMCCAVVQAQSISLLNLTNLATLDNKAADENLAAGRLFFLQSGEEVNGFLLKHYERVTAAERETLIIGAGIKTGSGAALHTVSYISSNPQSVLNLMSQTKQLNLVQFFHGSDRADNIYIYDSYLYRMTVRLSINNNKATVDISEKQVFVE